MSRPSKQVVLSMLPMLFSVALAALQRIALVPLLLSIWSIEDYTLYLIGVALADVQQIVGRSFETVLGRECLKNGGDSKAIANLFTSGIRFSFVLELAWAVIFCGILLLFKCAGLLDERFTLQILFSIVGSVCIVRCIVDFPLVTFGQILSYQGYPLLVSYVLLGRKLCSLAAPIVAYTYSAGPSIMICVECIAPLAMAPLGFWAFSKHLAKLIRGANADTSALPPRMYLLGIFNLVVFFGEYYKSQGIRLLIGPLCGDRILAQYVSLRMAIGICAQAIETVHVPLLPVYVRSQNLHSYHKMLLVFSLSWVVTIGIALPSLLFSQFFVEDVYLWWTRGKLNFDALTYALLAAWVTIYSLNQSFNLVLYGNNLIRSQIYALTMFAFVSMVFLWSFSDQFGIRAVGVSIVVGELTSLAFNVSAAKAFLTDSRLWRIGSSLPAILGLVAIGLTGLLCSVIFPSISFGLRLVSIVVLVLGSFGLGVGALIVDKNDQRTSD